RPPRPGRSTPCPRRLIRRRPASRPARSTTRTVRPASDHAWQPCLQRSLLGAALVPAEKRGPVRGASARMAPPHLPGTSFRPGGAVRRRAAQGASAPSRVADDRRHRLEPLRRHLRDVVLDAVAARERGARARAQLQARIPAGRRETRRQPGHAAHRPGAAQLTGQVTAMLKLEDLAVAPASGFMPASVARAPVAAPAHRRVTAEDKRVINSKADVNQLVPFKYKW